MSNRLEKHEIEALVERTMDELSEIRKEKLRANLNEEDLLRAAQNYLDVNEELRAIDQKIYDLERKARKLGDKARKKERKFKDMITEDHFWYSCDQDTTAEELVEIALLNAALIGSEPHMMRAKLSQELILTSVDGNLTKELKKIISKFIEDHA